MSQLILTRLKRLGHGSQEDKVIPTLVKTLQGNVVKISCGYDHMGALCGRGKVYYWGYGANGRLGLGDEEDRLVPTMVELNEDVFTLSSGGHHTAVASG